MSNDVMIVEGCSTHVRREGQGEPLFLLHGFEGRDWPEELIERLASRYQLIIPDHPGFGASDDPKWLRSIDDLAYFYLSLLEQLSMPSVRVLGHSLGGWVAAEMAIRQPRAIRSLVLVAPLGLRLPGVLTGDVFFWTREERIANLFHDPALAAARINNSSTKEELEQQLKNNYTAARLGWEPRFFNPTLERWVQRIACPAGLVWGDDDKVVPPSYVDVWRQKLPHAQPFVVKDCGHLVHIEKPKELAEIAFRALGES